MKHYIKTEKVMAKPMTVREFYKQTKQSQYGEMVENGEGDKEGYYTVDKDENDTGVPYWVSKDKFEKSYQVAETLIDRMVIESRDLIDKIDKLSDFINDSWINLSFSTAIILLKEGFAIRRAGWNGKGLFVIKQVPAHIDSDIIPHMQSLPQSAKNLILKEKGFIHYQSQCLIYDTSTGVANSWVPSVSDIFAEDWMVVTD